jgi:hypothetical protein
MDLLKIITLIVQMGLPLTFPDGDASLQMPLADKIEVICKDEQYSDGVKLHEVKNNPKFKKSKPSLFTKENTKDLYIFLTHIDSTHLFIEDCDYSLLKFLRYKANKQNLKYELIDSVTQHVNTEKLRFIRFEKGIELKLFENNLVFETTFNNYYEYWECSNKIDYSPKYPYVYPKRTSLRINYSDEQSEKLSDILKNPLFVFSIIPFDEMSYELPFNLNSASVDAELETTSGKVQEGKAIDLDNDKIFDAFWFNDVKDKPYITVLTRLYINLSGKWVPIWYTYFSEM